MKIANYLKIIMVVSVIVTVITVSMFSLMHLPNSLTKSQATPFSKQSIPGTRDSKNATKGLESLHVQLKKEFNAQYYLGKIDSCGSLPLEKNEVLILKYRFMPSNSIIILEYKGRDYVAYTDYATLTVIVHPLGESYEVTFKLAYKGKALRPIDNAPPSEWEAVDINMVKEIRTIYRPDTGYNLPNGTKLGRIFPLFVHGEELVVDYVWSRLGGRYSLGERREARANMISLTVWDLEKRLALELNGSSIIASMPFDSFNNKSLIDEVVKEFEKLRALSRCPDLLVVAHYSSPSIVRLEVDVDYLTGIPTFLVTEGAARYQPGGEYIRDGIRMKEMPASILADLFGIRSTIVALKLVDVSLNRS